jgi:hypothetical protein
LRRTALKNRSDHLQPFYSIRAVADHFHIPPATVSRIYRRLSSERLLRTVWGSKTLLEPIESAKRKQPSTVGVPVALARFTNSPAYRQLILNLQREIWNQGVKEHFMFFENGGEEIISLCKQQHFSEVDMIVWLSPDVSDKQTLLRLHDIGICLICVGDVPISGIKDYYTISPALSLRKIVRERILKIQ